MEDFDLTKFEQHLIEKNKHIKRIQTKRNKKKANIKKSKYCYLEGYYLKNKPYNYKYKKILVPEQKGFREVSYFDYFGNIRWKIAECIIPEHYILKRIIIDNKENLSYLARVDISNRRKFAKKQTNRRIRKTKYNELWYEDLDECGYDYDDIYQSNYSSYKKAFDYAWSIW